jgi:glutathione S-transferase
MLTGEPGNYKGIEGIVLRRSVHLKEKLLSRLIQDHPELREEYTAKLKDVERWNRTIQNAAEMANVNAEVEPVLDQLEVQLSQTSWLCGSNYSLADTVWTAVLNRLDELKFSHLWDGGTRPAIAAYLDRLRSRPSFPIAIRQDETPLPMLIKGIRRTFLGF